MRALGSGGLEVSATDPWAGSGLGSCSCCGVVLNCKAGSAEEHGAVLVYIVRKFTQGPEQKPEILSAWTDEYAAKHESTRWEQDTKIKHDYVRGWLGFASVEA